MARHVADLSLTQRRGSMKCKASTVSRLPGLHREWPAGRRRDSQFAYVNEIIGRMASAALSVLYRHCSWTSNCVSANFRNISLHYNDRNDSLCRSYISDVTVNKCYTPVIATQLSNVCLLFSFRVMLVMLKI